MSSTDHETAAETYEKTANAAFKEALRASQAIDPLKATLKQAQAADRVTKLASKNAREAADAAQVEADKAYDAAKKVETTAAVTAATKAQDAADRADNTAKRTVEVADTMADLVALKGGTSEEPETTAIAAAGERRGRGRH
jgi:hypothetical protein